MSRSTKWPLGFPVILYLVLELRVFSYGQAFHRMFFFSKDGKAIVKSLVCGGLTEDGPGISGSKVSY